MTKHLRRNRQSPCNRTLSIDNPMFPSPYLKGCSPVRVNHQHRKATNNFTTATNTDKRQRTHHRMSESPEKRGDDQLAYANEFSLFTKTLTFNVIGRYDPKLTNLLFHTSHCQLYKFSGSEDWEKLEFSGVLAVYSRDSSEDHYDHGMIILNRSAPENFSLGVVSKQKSQQHRIGEMNIEFQTDYIMVKDTLGNVYGFWIHDVNDRESVYTLVKALIYGEPLTPTTPASK